jgi:hypothetical protein
MDRAIGQDDVGAINRVHLVAVVAQDFLHDLILAPPIDRDKGGLVEEHPIGVIGKGDNIVTDDGFQAWHAMHGVAVVGENLQGRRHRVGLPAMGWILGRNIVDVEAT